MAIVNHHADASFYENVEEDFIDDLVNKELELMDYDVNDDEDNELNGAQNEENITVTDEITDKENIESDRVVDSVWSVYNDRTIRFYNKVESDIIESERILTAIPNNAAEVLHEIRSQIATALGDNVENVEKIIADAEKSDETLMELENEIKEINDAVAGVEGADATGDTDEANKIAQIEREFLLEIKKFEENQRKIDEERKIEEEARRKQAELEQQQAEFKWKQIQEKLQFEKDQLEIVKHKIDDEHSKMMSEQQRCIDRNLEILKVNLDQFTYQFQNENDNLVKLNKEYEMNEANRRLRAAILIQKFFRGYMVRKRFGAELKARIRYRLEKIEQRKIYEIEVEDEYQEEKRLKMEEERQRKLEYERKRLKEQQEFELEMEKVRLRKIEDEAKRVELEKQRLLEQELSYKKCLQPEAAVQGSADVMAKIDEAIGDLEKPVTIIEPSETSVVENKMPLSSLVEKLIADEISNAQSALLHEQSKSPVVEQPEQAIAIENEKSQQVELLKFELPNEIVEIYTQWRKHNMNNLLDNIRQEHNYKIKQLEVSNNKNVNKNVQNQSKSSSKKQIPESLLLKNSGKKRLDDIDSLNFQALTSYSLVTFELCTNLTFLTIVNSQITALDGLSNCLNLKYIDAQSNKIDWVDLRNLPQLVYLNLSNNNLSSIQNLVNCNNLRYLNISQNKLTRLGFLNPNFSNLQYLNVSKNQLINTIGLSNCINLQYIDLSTNNLNSIEDLETLPVLLELNGSKNNLLQMPDLTNQILLINLQLNDNSIIKLNDLNKYWMPLLKHIELNQNRINEIDLSTFSGLLILNDVKLENNDICELSSIMNLDQCCVGEKRFLNEIYLKNNPIINDDDIESGFNGFKLTDEFILKRDEQSSDQHVNDCLKSQFYSNLTFLNQKFTSHKPRPPKTIQDLNGFIQNLAHLNEFSIKLRYIFELNDVNFLANLSSQSDFTVAFQAYDVVHTPIKPIKEQVNNFQFKRVVSSRAERLHKMDDYKNYLNDNYTGKQLNKAATKIQSKWKGYKLRKELDRKIAHVAATVIQSRWRGYIVRKRLKNAKNKFKSEFDDEFNIYEEIDLKQFDFDEDKFEVKLPPGPGPLKSILIRKPQLEPVIGGPPLPSIMHQHQQSQSYAPYHTYKIPVDHGINDIFLSPTPTQFASPYPTAATSSSAMRQQVRPEEILNEWGFKDERTAMLMMQRADKMKYKPERKNKLKSLNPKERLKLLKRYDKFHVQSVTPRETPKPTQQQYVQQQQVQPQQQQQPGQKIIRTYEWLHSQVREFAPTPPAPQPPQAPVKLPQHVETKVPKLPFLKTPSTPPVLSNTVVGSRASEFKLESKVQMLPPLNSRKNIIDLDVGGSSSTASEIHSLNSSRSSFTQLYTNPTRQQPSKRYDNTKRRMT